MKNEFIILAQNASFSDDGNLIIFKTFDRFRTEGLPILPSFALVYEISGVKEKDEIGVYIELKRKGAKETLASGKQAIKIKEGTEKANGIINFNHLPLDKEGEYIFTLKVGGTVLGEKSLYVEKVNKATT